MAQTRRTVLQATVATVTLSATQTAMARTHPDAELIAACEEFDALERRYSALCDGPDAIADDNEMNEAIGPVVEAQEALRDKMRGLRATTLEGLHARIRTTMMQAPDFNPDEMANSEFMNVSLLGMVLRDLAEQAEVGSMSNLG